MDMKICIGSNKANGIQIVDLINGSENLFNSFGL